MAKMDSDKSRFNTPESVRLGETAGGDQTEADVPAEKSDTTDIRKQFYSLSALGDGEIDDDDDIDDDLSEFTGQFVGSIIQNRYEVEEPIGRGGMSSVYRARDMTTGDKVAFKVMHAHLLENPSNVRRFRREAQAANRVRHDHCVKIFDVGVTPMGSPYIIMDYLDGPSLSQVIADNGKLPVARCLKIFIQACEGMAYVHKLGVLHRDLKPSNIVLVNVDDDPDYVKVVDFGIAKVLAEEARSTLSQTPTGHALGSPPYMSPEQCRGAHVDPRADIYSMGCLMYESLTGDVPLQGETIVETMYKQVHEMPKGLTGVEADIRVVERLDKILFKALDKDADSRYQSFDELRADLEVLASGKAGGLKSIALLSREMNDVRRKALNAMGSSRKLVFSILCVFVAVVCAGVALYFPIYGFEADPPPKQREFALEQPLSALAHEPTKFKVQEEYLRTRRKLAHHATGEDSQQSFEVERMVGDFYKSAGRYNEAQVQYQLALKDAAAMKQGRSLDAAEVWLELGKCCMLTGKAQIAQICATSALSILDELGKLGGQDNLKALSILVDALQAQNLEAKADDAAMQFTKLWKMSGQSMLLSNEMAQPAYRVAEHLRKRGYYDLAEPLFKQSATCYRERGAPGRFNYGVCLNQLGLLELARGNAEKAKKYFDTSVDYFARSKGKEDISVAKVLFNRKEAEMKTGQFIQSVNTRATARKIWTSWQAAGQADGMP